ncbi:MAG TPA: tetratricopeptide repeat protein [Povalibacter sp.]|uniref:tetratricopeptide repeat protein n=1 Tax=Povalibacter sp. TaxID=1962978 RepID=UPI002BE31FF6|nr:tetratricopeptide repeat protein [Povalibacter sp.]HMN44968.1 tetratricopeptide repeat protein [Povalibacter sp.]
MIAILPSRLWAACLLVAAVGCAAAATTQPVPPSWQQEYWARFDDHDWDAAIKSAEQLVAAARPATAATGLRLAEALSLLGSAQLSKGDLVAAEAAFTEALQLAEQHGGSRSSAALIDPLRGLGYTLAAEGRHDRAIPYLDRALLLSRRSAGLFDISQQGLLRQLAASQRAVGSAPEGERHMLYLRRLGEHAYGANDPRLIPILCIVGDWYVEVGQMDLARQNYRAAVAIAERKLGKNSLAAIEPLRGFASSYTREIALSFFGLSPRVDRLGNLDPNAHVEGEPMNPRYLSGEGERALARALQVVQANPDASLPTVMGTLLQAGDWFVMKLQPEKAMPYYEHAAQALATADPTQATPEINAALSFPVQIFYPTPPIATRNLNRPATETVDHFVLDGDRCRRDRQGRQRAPGRTGRRRTARRALSPALRRWQAGGDDRRGLSTGVQDPQGGEGRGVGGRHRVTPRCDRTRSAASRTPQPRRAKPRTA